MGALKELVGQQFGKLRVVSRASNHKDGHAQWICICSCGAKLTLLSSTLTSGNTRSCGCFRSRFVSQALTTHGMSIGHSTVKGSTLPREYTMWTSAKHRAKRFEVPFNLELADIVIPEFCPVFVHVRLNRDNKRTAFDSPSLDRVIPELGYVKGNVRVISYRANTMKQDASLEEIKRLAEWLEGELYGAR